MPKIKTNRGAAKRFSKTEKLKDVNLLKITSLQKKALKGNVI